MGRGADPLAGKYPNWSPYVYTLDNPLRLTDPTGLEPYDPIITITNQIVGWAQQKIVRNYSKGRLDYITIGVPLYKATVTDGEDPNFRMDFKVTRDSWVVSKDNGGSMSLDNISFEPKSGKSNEYNSEFIDV